MDPVLINYLKSGQAWVLIGSGPSSEMGYPPWGDLAAVATQTIRLEMPGQDRRPLEKALHRKNYPEVFEEAQRILGAPRLLQALRGNLTPKRSGKIYQLMAEWPVPVYLTTNYDDEIQTHLTRAGETFLAYSNSEDDMGLLSPETTGLIVKLHGTLRSEKGLILTTTQYKEIDESEQWSYWRIKMTSIFQMSKIIVVGHSLTDNNIRHLLSAAKKGAAVDNPICWIAPNVPEDMVRQYLERFRIRVISYDNRDGGHRNLYRLVENLSEFVPPRTTVQIKPSVAKIAASPLGQDAAAPGFYVFNRLAALDNFEEQRADIILAAMESAMPTLSKGGDFTLKHAFEVSGWPTHEPVPAELEDQVRTRALAKGLISPRDKLFLVGESATAIAQENRRRFEHMSNLFKQSLELRAKNKFPMITQSEARRISNDIEASLTGYFREGGLSLTTTLFSETNTKSATVPSSIIKFINDSSAKYPSLLMRQVFSTISVDTFVSAGPAERDYLGRICQGFFAYHSLGVFGKLAIKRLEKAKDSVWLVDSNAQIPALALHAPTHTLFADTIRRLNGAGVRFFTTDKLFRETFRHLGFAIGQVKTHGPDSPEIIAAANGESPFLKSNQFLQGFLNWRALQDSSDWNGYLYEIFGKRRPTYDDAKGALEAIGIEVVSLDVWPGFLEEDLKEANSYTEEIVKIWTGKLPSGDEALESPDLEDSEWWLDPYKKANPEAEALLITKHEREGTYHMISADEQQSDAWFISDTSVLNLVDKHLRMITWPTIGFLRFASTLSSASDQSSADNAFQTLLLNCARSGLNIMPEESIMRVFGNRIDQDTIGLSEQLDMYTDIIEEKYGESPEVVLKRISPTNRYVAAVQLANEAAQTQNERLVAAETAAEEAIKRANDAEKRLAKLQKFEEKMIAKASKGKRIVRKQKARIAKKK
jgi:hypothetical protein